MTTVELQRRLWENAQDSVYHALQHFSELHCTGADKLHHRKWIILSVHHAAECFANCLLVAATPTEFQGAAVWYPSLKDSIGRLSSFGNAARFNPAEHRLLLLFRELSHARNE